MRPAIRRWPAAILFAAACGQGLSAQDGNVPAAVPAPAAPSMNDVAQLTFQDKLMPALVLLERLVEADPAMLGSGAQTWAYSGDIATADAWFARSSAAPRVAAPDLSDARPEPAIAAIVRAAEGKRIVIINEAHHAPRHRAFTHRLMLALREAGFTHFAAETFTPRMPSLLEDGAPMVRTGPYIRDPVFADLVRQAAKAGYGLVSYEMAFDQSLPGDPASRDAINHRELAQALNLKAALDADPAMRVLVHVGFGHGNEAGSEAWLPFGARLEALTGENPLTIDQIEGTRQHDRAHDAPLYTAFVTQFGEPAEPMAIGNDPARPLGNFRVDLSVIHPVQREVGGRPDWLAMGGYRKPHRVALAPLGERSLVRAFVVGVPAQAIAMDQILVPADAEAATLMLPAGDYRLVRQTVAGDDLPLGEAQIR